MFTRLVQQIRAIFANTNGSDRQPVADSRKANHLPQAGNVSRPDYCPNPAARNREHNRAAGRPGTHGRQSRFSGAHLQNATRLLRDGRLQIGIAGFHDTAFEVAVVNRHDVSATDTAITDLPCRVKMVADRNIADGVLLAQRMLGKADAGRRSIILITSGDSTASRELIENAAEAAAMKGIGIHVICLGPKPDEPTLGPRISTKGSLGYGGFRVVNNDAQLLAGLRAAFEGLLPAHGMRGTNRAVILLDCSETMVEQFRGATRIEMAMATIQEFLRDPLARARSIHRPNGSSSRHYPPTVHTAQSSVPSPAAESSYDWSPGEGMLTGAR